jgi:hypothetical protein
VHCVLLLAGCRNRTRAHGNDLYLSPFLDTLLPKKAGWAASSVAMGCYGEERKRIGSCPVDLDPNVHARQFRLSAGHASASLREKEQRHGPGRDIPGRGQGLPAHGKIGSLRVSGEVDRPARP